MIARFHSLLVFMIYVSLSLPQTVFGAAYNVLVIMSYEKPESNPWCRELKEGIDNILTDYADITYFYMNTKLNFEAGELKAQEAFEFFKKTHYDGVITADDNAQWMFAVKYLKDSKVPVMFCGVNADPGKYGYPASNISGILERGHFRQSIALIKQLAPEIQKVGFVVKESPSGRALKAQIEQEKSNYLVNVETFEFVKSLGDIVTRKKLYDCDAFFIDSAEGILDDNDNPLSTKQVISFLKTTFQKPVIGANTSHVEQGALCAVVKTGQEQGEGAAMKLLEALKGKPVAEIPITKNYKGKRIINVTVMEELGISPRPMSLLGSKLIKTK